MSSNLRKKIQGKKIAPRKRILDHPANLRYYDYREGNFLLIEPHLINRNPDQPRKHFNPESLAELSQSIKEKGVLQPIIIRVDEKEKYHVVAGERRLRAAKMAGIEEIPCIVTKGDPTEIALIENLQRENLKPIEEAEALARLMEAHSYTQEQLSSVIRKAKSTVSEALSLNRLPGTIKDEVRRAELYSKRLLVEVAKQETPEAMIALFEQSKSGKLKIDQVRKIIQKKRGKKIKSGLDYPTIKKVSGLNKELSNLRFDQFDKTQQTILLQKLEELKKTIDVVAAHIMKL